MLNIHEKLYLAVVKSQTANILTYLSQGAAVNTRNKDLETTLIKAARLRNYVVMKILLSKGANPSLKDASGLTALHHVASTGDVECIKLLLAHQAPIDALDVQGFSALHYAINRDHLGAVDILLFCGADACIKSKISPSPIQVATGKGRIETSVKDSLPALHGIKNRDVFIQKMELYDNSTYYFDQLDLTVHTQAVGENSISFLCRRVRPEYASSVLRPGKRNLLISDSFEFRISHTLRDTEVDLEIPLYNAPDPYDEIIMKTDSCTTLDGKPALTDVRRVHGKKRLICCTRVVLGKMKSFILMTRPKTEKVKTGVFSTHFQSTVDDYIEVEIPAGTFSKPGHLETEIIPKPAYKEDDAIMSNVLAVGNLYSMCLTNKEALQKNVTMAMPSPRDIVEGGNIVVVSTTLSYDRFIEDEGYEYEEGEEPADKENGTLRLQSWEILGSDMESVSGKVKLDVSHFSIHVPIQMKKATDERTIIKATDQLTQKAIRREKFVKFFAMVKPLGSMRFKIVVECTKSKQLQNRKDHWLGHDFREQMLEGTGEYCSVPGQEFVLKIVDRGTLGDGVANVRMTTGSNMLPLEFHPNRDNFQTFDVFLDDEAFTNFYINIDKKKSETETTFFTQLSVNLTGTPAEAVVEKEFEDSGFTGFTNDDLLWKLSAELGEEWMKVGIKLGLSFKTVQTLMTDKSAKETRQRKFKMLKMWRDMSKYRTEDLGVPDLMVAFRWADRQDMADFLNQQLTIWYDESKDKTERFCVWIETMRHEPNLANKEGTPEPLSDMFFMALIERVGEPLRNIGRDLGLSPPEMDRIFNSNLVKDKQLQLLAMLSTACDKNKAKKLLFFRFLKEALIKIGQQEAGDWVDSQAKLWIQETNEKTDNADKKKKRISGDNFFFLELAESYGLTKSSEV